MIKEISLTFLGELKEKVIEDKIKRLSINKHEGKYIAEYSLSDDVIGTDLKTISRVSSEIQMFSTALLLDKVEKLELHYEPLKDLAVINSEYTLGSENDIFDKARILADSLDRIQSLCRDLDLSGVKIDNLYEKIEGKNKKTRYAQVSVNECIKSLVKVLN